MASKKSEAKPRELGEKERRFVEAYMGEAAGNAGKAYKLAGYKVKNDQVAYSAGCRLLRRVRVKKELEERVKSDPLVASRMEIQSWLTKLMRGEDVLDALAKDRIKAAELVLKTRGDLLERREEKTESTVRYVVTTEDQLSEDERALMGDLDEENEEV